MANFKNDAAGYVAKVFRERLAELGMSQYRFLNNFDSTNQPTLKRILTGKNATSISTIAHYAELLGLELRLVKKEEVDNANTYDDEDFD